MDSKLPEKFMVANAELTRILSDAFRPEQWPILLQDQRFLRMVRQMETFEGLKCLVDYGRQCLGLMNDNRLYALECRRRNKPEEPLQRRSRSRPFVPTDTRLRWEEEND